VQPVVIAAGQYTGQDADVETVGLEFGVFTTADMPDTLVYGMAKSIAENRHYLGNVHTGFRAWDARTMPVGAAIPTHPGAARYYQERGWDAR
jgi:uncharacterized protein